MRISTNVASLTAQRRLQNVVRSEEETSMKLSSGKRIYKASIDPAGLAISEKLRAKSASLSQAERNASDAGSLIQIAEGTLSTLQDISIRLRELAVQAATDTLANEEREVANFEFVTLKKEINRLVDSVSFFNGTTLLDNAGGKYSFQVGAGSSKDSDRILMDMNRVLQKIDVLGIEDSAIRTKEGARLAIGDSDRVISKVSTARADIGGLAKRLESAITNLRVSKENTEKGKSQIADTDIAVETANSATATIIKSATMALLSQANSEPSRVLKLLE